MALGQHEAVAMRIVLIVGPQIELGAEQAGQNIGRRHRAARMAGAGMIDRRDRMLAREGGRLGHLPCKTVKRMSGGRVGRLIAKDRLCQSHICPLV